MSTPTTVQVKIQLRRDTAATWASVNPVLLAGEAGLETDTSKIKIGNGSTAWNSLGYFPFVVNGGTVTGNLEIGTTGTLTFEGSSADNFETTLGVVNPTADRTINLPNVSGTIITTGDTGTVTSTMIADGTIVDADVSATAEIAVSKLADGAARQLLQTDAAGTGVEWTSNIDIPGTLDVTGAATFDAAVTVTGDLTVNGTTTTISTQNLLVEDKNIIIGDVATPTDTTADGGGITLKGATDKTINWVDATDAWTSSERFSIPLGSAAAPSLTINGDTNTGLYSPGTDQLAISTGGSGRLFVDASGNVGLNVNPPTAYANYSTLSINGSSGSLISFRSAGTMVGEVFSASSALKIGTNTGQSLIFETNGGTERLRITSAGLVGIGTTSPTSGLAVNNVADDVWSATSSDGLALNGSQGGTSTITTFLDSSSLRIGSGISQKTGILITGHTSGSGSTIQLRTGNSERLRITSAGNVGIGTSSPGYKLDVAGTVNVVNGSNGRINLGATTNYLYGDSSGNLIAGNSGGDRVQIDSSGRLLVGTSSASNNLEYDQKFGIVSTGAGNIGGMSIVNYGGASSLARPILEFKRSSGTTDGSFTSVVSGDSLGSLYWRGSTGSQFNYFAEIKAEVDGTPGNNDAPGRIVLSTTADGASSPTERMRINSNGAVGTFTVDGVTGLNVSTAATAGTATIAAAVRYGATAVYGGTIGFQVYSNGNVQNTNNSYGAISDIKLKENIVDANSQWDDLKALQVRNYNFKEGQTHTQIGLVAQEVELVSPGLVSESPDRDEEGNDLGTVTKSVNYSVLYMKAVKALQEAMERIEQLEQRLNDAGIN